MDFQTLIQLYYSFIHAYLVNGLTTWDSTNITTLNHLTLLQKRAIRVITNSKKLDHTGPILLVFKPLCTPFAITMYLCVCSSTCMLQLVNVFNLPTKISLTASLLKRVIILYYVFCVGNKLKT